jgi:hypothetical protein
VSLSGCSEGIEVFYLIRWSNPVDLTRRFAESYLSYPPATDHQLTLIFKGFQSQHHIADHCSVFDGRELSIINAPDTGFDIGAYRLALESTTNGLCCFLNSHSIIRAPGWLKHLSNCALDPRIGIVGATASYESLSSDAMASIAADKPLLSMLRLRQGIPGAIRKWAYFPMFPNPHIRTNAFMIKREVFQRVRWPRNPSRMDALRFENGRRSLTRQVLKMGLDAVIVGRDGRRYEVAEWPSSGTFRQNEQHNVLVADNRTIEYATAAPEIRRRLAIKAWGTSATD